MTFRRKPGANTGRGVRTGRMTYQAPRQAPSRSTHGVNAMVGPTGSGKSLLAVMMARLYYDGKALDPVTGKCVCRTRNCEQPWTVYANMRGSARKEHGAWTQPLDLARDLLSSDSELSHAVVILDEGYQVLDSRRSVRNENVKISAQLTQIRKHDNRLFITAPSFDMIDVRIRQQVKRIFNCWTPDEGRHVMAAVHQMSLGYLPPWKRNRPPELKRFYTAPYRKFYDSWEQIRDDEALGRWKTAPGVFYWHADGSKTYVTHQQLIDAVLIDLVKDGVREVSPAAIAGRITSEIKAPVQPGYVRKVLAEAGFQVIQDAGGNDVFVILAGEEMGVA